MIIWKKRLIGAFAVKRIDKYEGVTFVQDQTLRCPIKQANAATASMKTAYISRRLTARRFTTKHFTMFTMNGKMCNAQNSETRPTLEAPAH